MRSLHCTGIGNEQFYLSDLQHIIDIPLTVCSVFTLAVHLSYSGCTDTFLTCA